MSRQVLLVVVAIVALGSQTTQAQSLHKKHQGAHVASAILQAIGGALQSQQGQPSSVGHTFPQQPQVIGDTGQIINGAYYDPATGRWIVHSQQNVVFDSALDPNRNVIDFGSLKYVNYYAKDSNGVLWHYTGRRWTSHGVPHSQIRRQSVTQSGNVIHGQTQTQAKYQGTPASIGKNQIKSSNSGIYGRW